jgi:hypothetical protein
MKKIFLLLTVFSMVFASCDPLEDIYAEIDAKETVIVGEANITLTDADHDALTGNSYGNFGSIAEAKTMIPGFLTNKYPVWGKNSGVKATFKYYSRVNTYSKNVYALSDAEHNAITGKTYGNFDKSYHITNFISGKYTSPSEGDFVSLRYRFYAGGETTLTDGFSYTNSKWEKITGFTADEYKSMGESYPNFSSHDEAAAKIPVTLVDLHKFNPKSAGDIVSAMYELYKGGGVTKSYTSNFIFDGTSFSKYNNVKGETIQFGHDGATWVPDNTIKYTLTAADYTLVGNGNYGNFDVRAGKDEETVASRVAKINTILLNNFPSDAEGQKYIVSYNIYNGANGVWQTAVIKTGSAYVLQ